MINIKHNTYYYKIYGLIIKSEIRLEELVELDSHKVNKVDVNISFSNMTDDIKKEIDNGRVRNYERGYIWFNIRDIGIYKIENGENITIECYGDIKLDDIKLYLLGSCLGIVLLEKDKLPIHGGSININNKGIILMGNKGAGKSTLTSALRLKGYNLISDDISVVEKCNGYIIKSGYPRQKLCEDAMSKLGYVKEKFETIIVDNKVKYTIPAEDKFINKDSDLNTIFYLSTGNVENVKCIELKGKEKLEILIENIYRIEVFRALGIQSKHIKQYLDIVKQIPMYKIERTKKGFTINEQIKLIENIII